MKVIDSNNTTAEASIRHVPMPPNDRHPSGFNLPLKDRVLVVIGANGSGKTRFGAWLDGHDINRHHRVSAHRSLNFPERTQSTDLEEAERSLFFGNPTKENPAFHRQHHRWRNSPATALLDDFAQLVTVMVSENFMVSDQYRVAMQSSDRRIDPPKTRLDLVKKIWEEVLPTRKLLITGNRIEAQNQRDKKVYHAKEMSDGERGIFHLIGEALSVPPNGIFIVDEPELHLHRAIQARLWDAIEAARQDCTFVYITHDLGFAASRKGATKIWLHEYVDGKANWEEVPDEDSLPESMLLEVVGSRKPILFVEGTRSSLDYFVYGKVYPEYCITPCESCENVVHTTKSFSALEGLHHNTCCGLVDHDGRSAEDIAMLEGLGVKVLPVALIENLFLTDSVLTIAALKLGRDPVDTLRKVKERVLGQLRKQRVRVVSNLTRQEIETRLRLVGKGEDGADALTSAFAFACNEIKPDEIYKRWDIAIENVLTQQDYPGALRYYKTKGLAAEADAVLGLKYQEHVMRWLRSQHAPEFIEAIRASLPMLPGPTVPDSSVGNSSDGAVS